MQIAGAAAIALTVPTEVMSRIAAPMFGGMVSAPLLSLFVVPAAYRLMRRRAAREPTLNREQLDWALIRPSRNGRGGIAGRRAETPLRTTDGYTL